MIPGKPWTNASFDLLMHAELHRLMPEDFDRRIAFISYDNSIEVAISTYLTLHPIQRNNKIYEREIVVKCQQNYHTKIEFFIEEIERRKLSFEIAKEEIIWYHNIRNKQYHENPLGIPEQRDLKQARKIALWVFSVLFDVPEIETLIVDRIAELNDKNSEPKRDPMVDKIIDETYAPVEVAGNYYETSSLLFAIDPIAYNEYADSKAFETSIENKKQKKSKRSD